MLPVTTAKVGLRSTQMSPETYNVQPGFLAARKPIPEVVLPSSRIPSGMALAFSVIFYDIMADPKIRKYFAPPYYLAAENILLNGVGRLRHR